MTEIKIQKQSKLLSIWQKLPYALAFISFVLSICLLFYSYPNISNGVSGFISKNLNLKVNNLYINGAINTTKEELKTAINITKGQSIFKLSTSKIREKLEELPWVRLAHVQRILPDKIKINIIEHKAIATIKFNNQRWALNSKGELINIVDDSFNHLLELSGKNSKVNASSLFSLFSEWSDLLFLVKQAEYIGNRRWNLYLENGIIVMLPEDNVRHALKVLRLLNQQQHTLSKQNIKIDLRNVQKHIIVDEKTHI